jgi:hypothetical protein
MLQQMAVRHIGKLLRRIVIKLHQHFTDAAFHLTVSFQPRDARRRFAVL